LNSFTIIRDSSTSLYAKPKNVYGREPVYVRTCPALLRKDNNNNNSQNNSQKIGPETLLKSLAQQALLAGSKA